MNAIVAIDFKTFSTTTLFHAQEEEVVARFKVGTVHWSKRFQPKIVSIFGTHLLFLC